MEIIKIAWRNIWRSKMRSLVVLTAVCLGITAGVFATALMIGMMNQRIETAINTEMSHIQIHNPDFIANQEQEFNITNSSELIGKIKGINGVKSVAGRLKITAMISSAENASGVIINGVIPADEKLISNLNTKITKGEFFTDGRSNEIIISQKLADKMKLDLKSKLILTFQDVEGTIVPDNFKVCGIYKTSNGMFDEMQVFVKKSHLCEITGYDENVVHEIAVLLDDNQELETIKGEVEKVAGKENLVRTWKQVSPDLGMMADMLTQYGAYIVLIILMALAFGIINTMLMAILERKKELGMMMAIGMNKAKIRAMIVWETLFLTFTGTIVGMGIAQVLVSYFGNVGIDLGMYAEGFEAVGYESILYPELNPEFYIQVVVLTVLTALFSAIFPIRRAIKMNPAEVLRTE